MKIYLIACFIMGFISFLQVIAKMQDFKQKYPFVKWKKKTFVQSLVGWIHTIFYFVCPVLNLIIFLAINFFLGDETWDKVMKQCAESF